MYTGKNVCEVVFVMFKAPFIVIFTAILLCMYTVRIVVTKFVRCLLTVYCYFILLISDLFKIYVDIERTLDEHIYYIITAIRHRWSKHLPPHNFCYLVSLDEPLYNYNYLDKQLCRLTCPVFWFTVVTIGRPFRLFSHSAILRLNCFLAG